MGQLHPAAALALTGLLIAGACAGNTASTDNAGTSEDRAFISKPATPKGAAGYSDPDPDGTRHVLTAGGSVAGTLRVSNNATDLRFEFALDGGAGISAVHVYTGTGNPPADADPGQFAGQAGFAEPVGECTLLLPLGELAAGAELKVAACVESGGEMFWAQGEEGLSSLINLNPAPSQDEMASAPEGISPAVQTGTGANQALTTDGVDWEADYSGVQSFSYRVRPVFEAVTAWNTYVASNNHPWGTWGADFTAGGWLPFEDQGVFTGWCVDRAHSMYTGQPYEIQLWSCFDPELPDFAKCDNYDLICYLITQRNTNHSYPWNVNWGTEAGRIAFQDAVWYFMGGGGMPGQGSLGYRIVQDALAHGEGFAPGPDEYYAAVLYPRTTTDDPEERAQEIVVEVPVPDHTI